MPKNFADVRRFYIDGKNSVTKNLPIPDIKLLNRHSYVSLMDCISDMLLSNERLLNDIDDYKKMIELQPKVLSLFGCERVKEIIEGAIERKQKEDVNLDMDVIVLFLKFWSDDFDPNNSIKSNRQSVWIQTVTIFAMTKDGMHLSYTYPIATSANGVDRDEVYELLSKEIVQLSSGPMTSFFSRYSKSPIKIHADIFSIMADQPERRSNLCLAAGNSRYHKRFGYLLDTNTCVDAIRACKDCEKQILDKASIYLCDEYRGDSSDWRIEPCNVCSGWVTFDKHKLLMYIPDKNYPASKLNKTGKLVPKQITKNHLESCLDDVRLALNRSIWTPLTCKAYLRSEGFNTKATDDIVDFTMNKISYNEAEANKDDDATKWNVIKQDYKNNPKKYNDWILPSSWYCMLDTSLYVDVPMHLLFLGVAKSVFIKTSKWLKIQLQSTAFKALTTNVLDQVKLYNLTWCKTLPYPKSSTDKFGGWVGENFLSFVRLSPWFYTLLYELKEANDVPNLETPVTAWRVKENRYWLDIRGLPSKGKANELKERVLNYLAMDDPPPIIPTTSIDKDTILTMLYSLYQMIAMLHSPYIISDDIGKIEIIIRKFLIHYDKVDTGFGKKDRPTWSTQYNFLCLLNLPNNMRKFGHVRNNWEGGIEGDRFLRNYKREMRSGLLPKWEMWTVRNLLQREVFRKENIDLPKTWKESLTTECRIYKSLDILSGIKNDNKAISAIRINRENKGSIHVLYWKNRMIKGQRILINWKTSEKFNEKYYYEIVIDDEIIDFDNRIGMNNVGVLLLPRISRIKENTVTYCLVSSDWRMT